jgi:hypothetical protein
MTSNQRHKRSSRTSKLDLECLGERIAPAVYQSGILGDLHHRAARRGWQSELQTLLRVNQQNAEKIGRIHGHGTITWNPFTLQNRSVTASIIVRGPVKRVPVVPIGSHRPVVLPFGGVFLNIISLPVKPRPNPPNLPNPPGPPVVTPFSLTNLASPNARPSSNSGGLPENVSTALNTIYQEYEKDPASFNGASSSTDGANLVVVNGDEVGIQVHDSNQAEFQRLTAALTSVGMSLSSSSATYGTVVGMLPISELLTVAQFSQSVSINPEYSPITR